MWGPWVRRVPGACLSRWWLSNVLGAPNREGGMGEVWEALHTAVDKPWPSIPS